MIKIEISDETYEKIKDQLLEEEPKEDLYIATGQEVIVRTDKAGVFFAKLKLLDHKVAILTDAIRLWYWSGACSLSQLAVSGSKKPDNCKFAVPVKEILVTDVIEILAVTNKARKQIKGIKSWKQ